MNRLLKPPQGRVAHDAGVIGRLLRPYLGQTALQKFDRPPGPAEV
jgi:hypothetical protein